MIYIIDFIGYFILIWAAHRQIPPYDKALTPSPAKATVCTHFLI